MQHQLCIVGGLGNMGRRYVSICKFLGIRYVITDRGDALPDSSHYLVCSPTETHMPMIRSILRLSKGRILCEKPIAIEAAPAAMEHLEMLVNSRGVELFMVNNYAFYPGIQNSSTAITLYDFYNCGPHGLKWDCIQLLHLARAKTILLNKSPIWKCVINGTPLNRERLDRCYVEMIQAFWKCDDARLWGLEDIKNAHLKAVDFQVSS